MCGRFTLRTRPAELAKFFQLLREPPLNFRYNIAPTQPVAAIRRTDQGRELSMLHWGLIPFWADDPKIGNRMINARAESVAVKPPFRAAFKQRRCLIPADGFYEWKKTDGKTKQPYYVRLTDNGHRPEGGPFAFAGLWEHWERKGEPPIESCTIITTDANEVVGQLHNRMPVILHEDDYDRWLDPKLQKREELQALLAPYPSDAMEAYPVSTVVNNPRNDGPECIEPADRE